MLAELQDWMQAAILDRDAPGLRGRVRGDNRLTAEDRIGIYMQGYRLRLIECLRSEYPMLAALAGETAFGLFAQGYIAAHPSRSYTLYEFAAGFADYLEAARPPGDGPQAIPAELARIERARAEILRARGVESEPAPADSGIDPLIAAMAGRFWRPDSVRLLALPFDFTETLASKESPPLPAPTPSLLAIARAQYRVETHKLTPWQYDWLASLPATRAEAAPAGDARLAAWLPFATRHGLAAAA